MSNSPTHLRSSSSAFNFTVQPDAAQPQPQAPAQPVNVMVGSRPSMVSTPERAIPPPAGGFQRRQSATPLEEHKALPAAGLPSGVFTPLKPEQSVDSSVALILEGAKGDAAAMSAGFAKLLTTRVVGGVELDRVAAAILESIEGRFVPSGKDGKHQAQPSAADPALRAALQALRSRPSVNMNAVLAPMLARARQPDALIRAWFHAQTGADGEIHGSFWTTALEALAGTASAAYKSPDWLDRGLDGVVSALDEHLSAAQQAWTASKRQEAVDDDLANLGIPTVVSVEMLAQRAATAKRLDSAKKSPTTLMKALVECTDHYSAQQLASAVLRTTYVANRHGVETDRSGEVTEPDRSEEVLASTLGRQAFALADGMSLEDAGRAAAALRDARLAGVAPTQRDDVLREVLAEIDAAVDKRFPPKVGSMGEVERSTENIDTQRAIKRQLLKASAQVAGPQSASPSSMQSSSTTTTTSHSSSLG